MIRRLYNLVNRNWWQFLVANLAIILALVCILLLTSCGASREQKQHAADALAGVEALSMVPEVAANATASNIVSGLPNRIQQAVGLPAKSLPAPTMAPAVILAQSATYAATAPAVPEDPMGGMLGWMVAAAGAALAGMMSSRGRALIGTVFKLLPGPWGWIANAGWEMLANRQQRSADEQAQEAMRIVKELAANSEELKQIIKHSPVHPDVVLRLLSVIDTIQPKE